MPKISSSTHKSVTKKDVTTSFNQSSEARQDKRPTPDKFFIRAWLICLSGLVLAGCNYIQIGRPEALSDNTPAMIFATVTPTPQVIAQADQSTLPAAEDEELPILPVPDANELGKIMILEYHRIGYPEGRYQRTPDNFRADLQRLYNQGYYPVNFIDVIEGLPQLPPGKKPVVITFDDSDITQFHILEDQKIDSNSAVGILLDFHEQHPATWPTRATFFVLGDDTGDHYAIFGQSSWAAAKIQFLVDLGMEIGSHTANHVDLSVASAERIHWELAISKHVIEQMAPGYTVKTMSVPYGGFPYDLGFLKAGQWGEYSYSYTGNAAAWGGPAISPFDTAFEPHKVTRIEVTGESFDRWLTYFEQNPHEYYLSDGDPNRVAAPQVEIATE